MLHEFTHGHLGQLLHLWLLQMDVLPGEGRHVWVMLSLDGRVVLQNLVSSTHPRVRRLALLLLPAERRVVQFIFRGCPELLLQGKVALELFTLVVGSNRLVL